MPIFEKTNPSPLLIISNKPLFLNKEIATNIPNTWENNDSSFTPLFAPLQDQKQ
jgi:hypothetical protein